MTWLKTFENDSALTAYMQCCLSGSLIFNTIGLGRINPDNNF